MTGIFMLTLVLANTSFRAPAAPHNSGLYVICRVGGGDATTHDKDGPGGVKRVKWPRPRTSKCTPRLVASSRSFLLSEKGKRCVKSNVIMSTSACLHRCANTLAFPGRATTRSNWPRSGLDVCSDWASPTSSTVTVRRVSCRKPGVGGGGADADDDDDDDDDGAVDERGNARARKPAASRRSAGSNVTDGCGLTWFPVALPVTAVVHATQSQPNSMQRFSSALLSFSLARN